MRRYTAMFLLILWVSPLIAEDELPLNPFGSTVDRRDDSVSGYIELSDGSIIPGRIYLTRGKMLKIYDPTVKLQREFPLRSVKKIRCIVKREWLEKEWKFKETTSDEKLYTGRSYPVRECLHTIDLSDGRAITGPISALIYIEPENGEDDEAKRFTLHKRQKGEMQTTLNSLVYVKFIRLGDEALAEGRKKAAEKSKNSAKTSDQSQ